MLVKLDCVPAQVINLSLKFDDGKEKEVTLRNGLYASFSYMYRGVLNEFAGKVVNAVAPKPKYDIPVTDPHAIVRPMHTPMTTVDGDIRYYVEVEGTNRTVRIDVYSIADINTIFETTKNIVSPEDETQIRMIRRNKGNIEFSYDGAKWDPVTITQSTIDDKLADMQKTIDELSAKVTELSKPVVDDTTKEETTTNPDENQNTGKVVSGNESVSE